jgi:hypothetical protein
VWQYAGLRSWAELVDAIDLGSVSLAGECGFNPADRLELELVCATAKKKAAP